MVWNSYSEPQQMYILEKSLIFGFFLFDVNFDQFSYSLSLMTPIS